MSTNWAPLILAVAPNGARKTQQDHPALPITPEALARLSSGRHYVVNIAFILPEACAEYIVADGWTAALEALRRDLGNGRG